MLLVVTMMTPLMLLSLLFPVYSSNLWLICCMLQVSAGQEGSAAASGKGAGCGVVWVEVTKGAYLSEPRPLLLVDDPQLAEVRRTWLFVAALVDDVKLSVPGCEWCVVDCVHKRLGCGPCLRATTLTGTMLACIQLHTTAGWSTVTKPAHGLTALFHSHRR